MLRDPTYEYVVVMARWTVYLEGTAFDNGEGGIEQGFEYLWVDGGVERADYTRSDAVRKAAVAESFKQAIQDLIKMGKTVFLVYPVPEVGWDVPSYAAKKILHSGGSTVTTSYDVYVARNAAAMQALDSLGQHDKLIRIRPAKVLCNEPFPGRCNAVLNGVPLYYNDDHLSNVGARLLTEQITEVMLQH